jgi:uncharacterized protein YaaN involved in tellurite resistance
VAFPQVTEGGPLPVPEAPETVANTGLAVIAKTPETRNTLSCLALLQGDTLQRAYDDADQLYEEMLSNTQVFMTYGSRALDGVNDLVERLLHEVEPTDIPELTALMKDLNREMRSVRNKYDVSDPKVAEKYAEWKGGIARLWGKGKTLIELLMEDVQSIETQLNKVAKTLKGRQLQLIQNVGYYDELYVENEAEIIKVIYVVAVMEIIREKAAMDAKNIEVGDANLGDRKGERKAALAQFAENMSIKISEYKGRLFIAWSTSPQVRNMRNLDVALAERVNELLTITIPTMKATIVQWRLLIQTEDAAKLSAAVAEEANNWLQAYAAAGAEVVPRIARIVEEPSLKPSTITAMADSLAKQADGIVQAMEMGAQRRAENEQAILAAQKVIADSNAKVSDALVQQVVEEATRALPIQVTDSVPYGTDLR